MTCGRCFDPSPCQHYDYCGCYRVPYALAAKARCVFESGDNEGKAMTDRELWELAAKAAGMWDHKNDCIDKPWTPLHDDGDALRLAVKLRIDIPWQGLSPGTTDAEEMALIRRAIVHAAAVIGQKRTPA
jgi:hypothetical protein